MDNLFNNIPADENASTTTGEPVTTQAPTTPDTQNATTSADTTPDIIPDDTTTPDTTPADTTPTAPVYLPTDYLSHGYYATAISGEKYLRPEFVGEYAEKMASLLSDMKPSDFTALLLELKSNKKSKLPFEARMTAALELIPKSMQLVNRHKAPSLLIAFIKQNIDCIHNDDDWTAFYRHLDAIAGFMSL